MAVAEPVQQLRESKTDSTQPTRKPARTVKEDTAPSSFGRLTAVTVLTVVSVLMWVAYKVAVGKYYEPRSNFGFYLGVVGSLMMVALLTYPLRKHIRFMQRWGALKHWFRWHMVLGIVGPTFILFHSTFHLRSLNATIALVSMLIVVASGVIGRFVYARIHHGLYGSRATLEFVQQEFASQSDNMRSRFHIAPRVEEWLESFTQSANQAERSFVTMCWHLLALGWKRRICAFRCARELRAIMRRESHPEFGGGVREAITLAKRFLRQAERVAEFTTYERLFSLWHMFHIPLIFLLAASSIFHIIAVYMY